MTQLAHICQADDSRATPSLRHGYPIAIRRKPLALRLSRVDKNEFMAACRDGGAAIAGALRTLDRSYFAQLHGECRRMLRDSDLAREVVHETFIKVWRRCATFQGDSELLPWIRAILRRTTLDHLRAPVREFSFDPDQIDAEMHCLLAERAESRLPSPDSEARSVESAACFERCWQKFVADCPQHAAVIAWIAEDGLDTRAISELLERSPGATREYISQCRKRARFYLAEWHALVLQEPST
jgi:RNA polymerase sigma factor (sigma-70 family)